MPYADSRSLTKFCYAHKVFGTEMLMVQLGRFLLDDENWQDDASLDDRVDGGVGLTKRRILPSANFDWNSVLDQNFNEYL